MHDKKELVFDTSAINGIADEADGGVSLIRSIGLIYHIDVSETVIAEVTANSDAARRRKLFEVLDRLVHCGHCIMPFQWIIEHQAKAYQEDMKGFKWKRLSIRLREAEDEIARQELLHSLSDETRESNRRWNRQFDEMFSSSRSAFQSLFEAGEERPSVRVIAEHLMSGGGAFLSIAAGLMERATKILPSESEVLDFIERCPPFKALLLAICVAQYDRCIRDEGEPWLGKAGRYDMLSATYLPYCRVFVTKDEGQGKALKTVAELMGLEMNILRYEDFKARLCGLSSL